MGTDGGECVTAEACSAQRAVAMCLCAPWASRSDPSGLITHCTKPSNGYPAEAFGNSFEDSVSFRFPSPQSLGVSPLLRQFRSQPHGSFCGFDGDPSLVIRAQALAVPW